MLLAFRGVDVTDSPTEVGLVNLTNLTFYHPCERKGARPRLQMNIGRGVDVFYRVINGVGVSPSN